MIIFTYIYHKHQLFMSVNIPVPWIRHGICIPCAYHSAPPLSVLRVNRFWTSQCMKSPARATKGGPDTLWGFPPFPGHCRSWNPVTIHQFLGNFTVEGPDLLKGCNWKSRWNMTMTCSVPARTDSFQFVIKKGNSSRNIPEKFPRKVPSF